LIWLCSVHSGRSAHFERTVPSPTSLVYLFIYRVFVLQNNLRSHLLWLCESAESDLLPRSVRTFVLPSYTYIIPQNLRFVKRFLKNFSKNFSGEFRTYYFHGRLSAFMLKAGSSLSWIPFPLDTYIIPHFGTKVNRQIAQSFAKIKSWNWLFCRKTGRHTRRRPAQKNNRLFRRLLLRGIRERVAP
jgi:hypothetical protein